MTSPIAAVCSLRPDLSRSEAAELVLAVLVAIRKPSERMEIAWGEAAEEDYHPMECHINDRRWAAAIDAMAEDVRGERR